MGEYQGKYHDIAIETIMVSNYYHHFTFLYIIIYTCTVIPCMHACNSWLLSAEPHNIHIAIVVHDKTLILVGFKYIDAWLKTAINPTLYYAALEDEYKVCTNIKNIYTKHFCYCDKKTN